MAFFESFYNKVEEKHRMNSRYQKVSNNRLELFETLGKKQQIIGFNISNTKIANTEMDVKKIFTLRTERVSKV